MTARIHPTAIVDAGVVVADDVEIGPWALVGPKCTIGPGCVLAPRSVLESNVRLGANVKVGIGAVLGGLPQDLKFKGEDTWVEIGDDTTIREYVTVNRGTTESWKTTVGSKCFLMAYVHLAHDCHVGNNVIIANAVQMGGHVTVEDNAGIGGVSGVHQFSRIGRFSYIGGHSRVTKDVPPFVKAVGNPIKYYGLNSVGMQRNGIAPATIAELKKAYRLLFRSELNVTQAIEQAKADLQMLPEVAALIEFFELSERGAAR